MNEPYFALTLYNFILIVAIFFLVMIIVSFVANLGKFLQELRRLNGKIRLSQGAKRKHLLRRRRRLWLSLLPFIKY